MAIPFINGRHHDTCWRCASRSTRSPAPCMSCATRFPHGRAGRAWRSPCILGIPLAGTLVRRLRRLREAALGARAEGGPLSRGPGGPRPRRGRRPRPRVRHDAAAPASAGGGAARVRGHRLARAAHAADLARRDARAARRRPRRARSPTSTTRAPLVERARAQSRRLGRLAADLLDLSRLDAEVELRSEPVELGELSRAVLAEFELGTERARDRLDARRRSAAGVGARRPRQRRPDPADPARQRGARQPRRRRDARSSCATATTVVRERLRRGSRRARGGARADLRALQARRETPAGRRASGSVSRSVASWPSGWAARSCSRTATAGRDVHAAPARRPRARGRADRGRLTHGARRTDSITRDGQALDEGDARGRRAPLVVSRPPADHPRRARPAAAAARARVLDAGLRLGPHARGARRTTARCAGSSSTPTRPRSRAARGRGEVAGRPARGAAVGGGHAST